MKRLVQEVLKNFEDEKPQENPRAFAMLLLCTNCAVGI